MLHIIISPAYVEGKRLHGRFLPRSRAASFVRAVSRCSPHPASCSPRASIPRPRSRPGTQALISMR